MSASSRRTAAGNAAGPDPGAGLGAGTLARAFSAHVGLTLDPFQVEAIEKLERSRGVLVSAPTSSGKTLIAEYAIWRCLAAPPGLRLDPKRAHRVIYTTPLKALSNQKFRDLGERYGVANVGLVTGEHTLNESAPVVVMTTEILRNILYDEPARLDRVGDIILDEVHYIDDYPRGTVWEEVIIEAPRHIRITGLSATISNVDEVAAWMSGLRGGMEVVTQIERPVALELWLCLDNQLWPLFDERGQVDHGTLEKAQNLSAGDLRLRYARRAPENDLLQVIERLRGNGMLPAIYFIFSRRGCREAISRCAVHGLDLTTPDEKLAVDTELGHRLEAIADDDERRVFLDALDGKLLRRGIAMHHAGMLPYAKETVEVLFQRGLVKVVFATETLSLGLNMPARACVVSSFTKFDGTGFHALTPAELTQLMGRAGRRGIDTLGHGIILKESDVDVRDIYDAAIGGEMSVESKFAPTYTMVLALLKTRSLERAEELLDRSFGQYQALLRSEHWVHRKANLETLRDDLARRVFRHPRLACSEVTLTRHLRLAAQVETMDTEVRRAQRQHWRDSRAGRYGGRAADPGGRFETMRRSLKASRARLEQSPCTGCPHLSEHRGHRRETEEVAETLRHGEEELRSARGRYRREFRALRGVLREAGFLENDRPTELGLLAEALFGESALVVADAIQAGWLEELTPPELVGVLTMLVADDRGRDRPTPARRQWPSRGVERGHRLLRADLQRLGAIEEHHGVATLRPLSFDFVAAAHQWASGVALAEIDVPPGADVGDLVKAVKNLYSLLRQMEQALREHRLAPLVRRTREAIEREMIRRI
ncbi:MAG: DEAD/DEAH box helicase [Candidatus Dormibacteria bacterium]